ncbi:glycosyl transferase family 1 [Winogradskyella wandonensis]|uniref:Glycosyl transferase family 1 n=1 Tax=Winogradskyella wandonensis TaxID=1442586 RepID=A0A4R1KRX6_9FLAO|nr:glycosyltransferase [Winogradskyella wandonensis]TCK67805.1 glycosyl transferase family 1 [Winogradskyella wandonensis]
MRKKIILEASNIYSGGGLVLLKLLLEEIQFKNVDAIIYLNYNHVINEIEKEGYKNLEIKKSTFKSTIVRYFKKRSNVVFLCNLPPFFKNKRSSLVFYNELFFKKKNLLTASGIKFQFYNLWFRLFCNNVDRVLVQSPHIEKLINKKTRCRNVINIPIYKKFNKTISVDKKYDFCYVSSGAPHKNHAKLFHAISILNAQGHEPSVVLTIPKTEKKLIESLHELNKKNNNKIVNLGYIDNSEIEQVYSESSCLIFPSIAEAFGMPLIEAHDLGLRVLVSDLPYAYDVFEKVETFNPKDALSIAEKMKAFLDGDLNGKEQISKVENKLDEYVNILLESKNEDDQ